MTLLTVLRPDSRKDLRLHLLLHFLITLLTAQSMLASSNTMMISDGLEGHQNQDANIVENPTDVTSAGCHRAVDKNGTVRFLVLDAGSTGTRAVLHKFRFERPAKPGSLKLRHLGLRRYSRKPGLSAFRNFPDRCRDQMTSLLTAASADVPAAQRAVTCVTLRATAGLRLLDTWSRQRILRVVKSVLATSAEFLAPDIDAAKVLTGPEEAKFAWLSVNYMLGNLAGARQDSSGTTAPVLEMGGGSIQVAYEYPDGELSAPLPPSSSSEAPSNGRRIRARSYLGLGTRESVLRFVGYKKDKTASGSSRIYRSSCIASNLTAKFSFGSVQVQLSGNSRDSKNSKPAAAIVSECFSQANKLIYQLQVRSEPGLVNSIQPLYAISSVYYLVKYIKKHGTVGTTVSYNDSVCPNEPRGACKAYTTTVGAIANNAASICRNPPRVGSYEPYYCINLAILTSLLRRFNLPDQAAVVALGGSDSLGWTLGFGLDALLQSAATPSSASSITRASLAVVWLQPMLLLAVRLFSSSLRNQNMFSFSTGSEKLHI